MREYSENYSWAGLYVVRMDHLLCRCDTKYRIRKANFNCIFKIKIMVWRFFQNLTNLSNQGKNSLYVVSNFFSSLFKIFIWYMFHFFWFSLKRSIAVPFHHKCVYISVYLYCELHGGSLFRTFNSYSFNFNVCGELPDQEASSFCDFWKLTSCKFHHIFPFLTQANLFF